MLDEASFASLNYAQPDYLERGRRRSSLAGSPKAEDYVWTLSGGRSTCSRLPEALALEPEVIILDQPIAQLDPYHARQTYEALRDLNERYGKTIIVIRAPHDFIADYCKHAVLMVNGAVSWKLTVREALRQLDDLAASDIYLTADRPRPRAKSKSAGIRWTAASSCPRLWTRACVRFKVPIHVADALLSR